jgi:type I restriction enzyme S subunit
VKPFKRVTTRIDVGIAEAATHAYASEGVPIIRSTNVKQNFIEVDDLLYIEQWFAEKNRSKYLYTGDIVTVRTGAYAGMTAFIPEVLNQSQCFTLLMATLARRQNPEFYSFYINSPLAQKIFAIEGYGSAKVNLSVPIMQNLPIVEPPYEEQEAIVSYIKTRTKQIDLLLEKKKTSIEKLKEYRTALISAAVTGKIDVRNEVAS